MDNTRIGISEFWELNIRYEGKDLYAFEVNQVGLFYCIVMVIES